MLKSLRACDDERWREWPRHIWVIHLCSTHDFIWGICLKRFWSINRPSLNLRGAGVSGWNLWLDNQDLCFQNKRKLVRNFAHAVIDFSHVVLCQHANNLLEGIEGWGHELHMMKTYDSKSIREGELHNIEYLYVPLSFQSRSFFWQHDSVNLISWKTVWSFRMIYNSELGRSFG